MSTEHPAWTNFYQTGRKQKDLGAEITELPLDASKNIQPWLTALFQSEHISLLAGSGLTHATLGACGGSATSMRMAKFHEYGDVIDARATDHAAKLGRGSPNLEDQIRAANELIAGLEILKPDEKLELADELSTVLKTFYSDLLKTEATLKSKLATAEGQDALGLLQSFLMSFASRNATRERLHIFTTNYDRFIELGCDHAGIRVVDRFVGCLEPIFRASRLDVDYHFNPPGIKGEPRYLEGVVRLTKLHGSLDWRWAGRKVVRADVRFGSESTQIENARETLMIYPNSTKDFETTGFPYVELFRDFSAALCRPNSVLVTYGYSFGDDHINRVIEDMLTIPSTHLVIISHSDTGGRIQAFCRKTARRSQTTILIGKHLAGLESLVEHLLPKPAIDLVTNREVAIRETQRKVEGETDKSITDDLIEL
jgi:hypothetical protein